MESEAAAGTLLAVGEVFVLGVIGLDDGFGDPAPRSTTMPLLLVPACGVGGRLKQVSEVARSPSNDALAPCNTPKSENIQISLTFGSTRKILGLNLFDSCSKINGGNK